jgi:hypothetical protein
MTQTGFDYVIYDGLILIVLFWFGFLTALDVFLDAFIDKNLSELIFGICDIE